MFEDHKKIREVRITKILWQADNSYLYQFEGEKDSVFRVIFSKREKTIVFREYSAAAEGRLEMEEGRLVTVKIMTGVRKVLGKSRFFSGRRRK